MLVQLMLEIDEGNRPSVGELVYIAESLVKKPKEAEKVSKEPDYLDTIYSSVCSEIEMDIRQDTELPKPNFMEENPTPKTDILEPYTP
jgi:hypothetical protein